MTFTVITTPDQFRVVTRAHLLPWRRGLEKRSLVGATIRHKLAALSSLFEYLCEVNAVMGNLVKGQAPENNKQRKQDAGNRRPPSAVVVKCARHDHDSGAARSRHFIYPPLSRPAPR